MDIRSSCALPMALWNALASLSSRGATMTVSNRMSSVLATPFLLDLVQHADSGKRQSSSANPGRDSVIDPTILPAVYLPKEAGGESSLNMR
jgi:hypothetical protein